MADPVTLYIHRSRRTTHPTAGNNVKLIILMLYIISIIAAPSSSGSDETMPVPTKRKRGGSLHVHNTLITSYCYYRF